MKCVRCGKDISFSNYTIAIPVSPFGYEHHKVCSECNNAWKLKMFQTFYEFVKEGDEK